LAVGTNIACLALCVTLVLPNRAFLLRFTAAEEAGFAIVALVVIVKILTGSTAKAPYFVANQASAATFVARQAP
jgi:hypothetical protein